MATNTSLHALKFYKYLPFNEGSLKVITEGTLKFTSPLEFNDPFDCQPFFYAKSVESYTKAALKGLRKSVPNPNLSPADRVRESDRLARRAKHKVSSGGFHKDLLSTVGIVSLTVDPHSILMWSHYADHHRGFIVELAIDTTLPKSEWEHIFPLPVEYSENRPCLDWGSLAFDLKGYFLTKSADWKYEAEHRIITTTQGPGIHRYPRAHVLSSVIAGARMEKKALGMLIRACTQASAETSKKIPVHRAALDPRKFKVRIPGFT